MVNELTGHAIPRTKSAETVKRNRNGKPSGVSKLVECDSQGDCAARPSASPMVYRYYFSALICCSND